MKRLGTGEKYLLFKLFGAMAKCWTSGESRDQTTGRGAGEDFSGRGSLGGRLRLLLRLCGGEGAPEVKTLERNSNPAITGSRMFISFCSICADSAISYIAYV